MKRKSEAVATAVSKRLRMSSMSASTFSFLPVPLAMPCAIEYALREDKCAIHHLSQHSKTTIDLKAPIETPPKSFYPFVVLRFADSFFVHRIDHNSAFSVTIPDPSTLLDYEVHKSSLY